MAVTLDNLRASKKVRDMLWAFDFAVQGRGKLAGVIVRARMATRQNRCLDDFPRSREVRRAGTTHGAHALCRNGKWRAFDGGASGTTPYRVFFKDGVFHGSQ